mmetsp:Transcript_31042/g.101197  ORF Transcript_31042/g.101197 Transcript_31042/m.101197 type:complete len:244 (-) Transcript_31042:167-898(-)
MSTMTRSSVSVFPSPRSPSSSEVSTDDKPSSTTSGVESNVAGEGPPLVEAASSFPADAAAATFPRSCSMSNASRSVGSSVIIELDRARLCCGRCVEAPEASDELLTASVALVARSALFSPPSPPAFRGMLGDLATVASEEGPVFVAAPCGLRGGTSRVAKRIPHGTRMSRLRVLQRIFGRFTRTFRRSSCEVVSAPPLSSAATNTSTLSDESMNPGERLSRSMDEVRGRVRLASRSSIWVSSW